MAEPVRESRAASEFDLIEHLLPRGVGMAEAVAYATLHKHWRLNGRQERTMTFAVHWLAGVLASDPRTVRRWLGKLEERGLLDVAEKPEDVSGMWRIYLCQVGDLDQPREARQPDPQREFWEANDGDPDNFAQICPGPGASGAQTARTPRAKLAQICPGSPPDMTAGQDIDDACARIEFKEGMNERTKGEDSKLEEPSAAVAAEVRERGNEIYRGIAPTNDRWFALAAAVREREGKITKQEVDELVLVFPDRFAKQLKSLLGKRRCWLAFDEFCRYSREVYGLEAEARWAKPDKPRATPYSPRAPPR